MSGECPLPDHAAKIAAIVADHVNKVDSLMAVKERLVDSDLRFVILLNDSARRISAHGIKGIKLAELSGIQLAWLDGLYVKHCKTSRPAAH